jgi:G3E family GTPase
MNSIEGGLDQELLIGAEEEICESASGCICCTVRGEGGACWGSF